MGMTIHPEPAQFDEPATPSRGQAALLYLVASWGIVAWLAASMFVIKGFGFWGASPVNLSHVLLSGTCMAIAVAHGARLQGSLDYKLSQGLAATFLVFGAYALAILGGRLFFSRPMLVSTALGAVLITMGLICLRHRLYRLRIGVLPPRSGLVPVSIPDARVIPNSATDLREFDVILVSLNEPLTADWSRALARGMLAGCKVRHIVEYAEELRGAVSLDHFDVDHLPPNGIASYRLVKRLTDVGLTILLLPLVAPVLLVAGAAIYASMGRPIFFVQDRVGYGGESFRIWKLRTMRADPPEQQLRPTIKGDNRVTAVGRVLRRFRIDELPQLWNVVKGDMSLIGPRPEAVPLHREYLEKLPKYAYRYLVRPGITGWAQVSAPPSASAEEARRKLTYDLFYVKKLSLYLDIQIALRTLWTIVAGSGVR